MPNEMMYTSGKRGGIEKRPGSLSGSSELILAIFIGTGCILFAQLVALGLNQFSNPWRMSRGLFQFFVLLWGFAGGILLAYIVFWYIGLRQMKSEEATLAMQDILWQETLREQTRIQRWRVWAKKRYERR